ncbi:MAG: PepSY domain-containing protein [Polynucleobacter sp.]|nr:PepSY domain-containing protein [Polynucleobacter sp.]MDZ4058271.1 PepSY domain-containing protein [Polynucleobacter sp.]
MVSLLRFLLAALLITQSHLGLADSDHDRARKAVEQGEVLPLQQILQKISKDYPGQVLEVELERENRAWVYEIKQLSASGVLTKLEVDAKTGAVIKHKSKKY